MNLRSLLSPFGYLNTTQFLGGMNDNIFKLLTVFCFIFIEGEGASNTIIASVGAIYVIPFLLLSSTAGTMADKFSKRTIIIGTKIAEFCVMLLGMWAFALGSKILAFSSLFLLACHSAIFAPCKYSIVPEIVPQERISKANGLLTSCTFMAVIIGTFLASFITDITHYNFILSSSATLVFALLGLYTAFKIPKTAPSGSKKEISPRFLSELFRNIRLIYQYPTLLSSVLGSAFFLFVGSYTQLNMIPFAIHSLDLSDVHGGYLFLLTALGIGIGSLLAGKLSGNRVELGLVPIGGFGIAACFLLLGTLSHHLVIEIILSCAIGIFGGLYLVPLDSYIQFASPKTFRGQVVATGNFLGFFGVLLSAAILYLLSEVLALDPATGFLVMGFFTLGIVSVICIAIRGHVLRFWCSVISKFFPKKAVVGKDLIPSDTPSFVFSSLPAWPWLTILLGSQSRRMQPFLVRYEPLAWYFRLCGITRIATCKEVMPDGDKGELIRYCLERGTSPAFFCSEEDMKALSSAWKSEENGYSFFTLLQTNPSSDRVTLVRV